MELRDLYLRRHDDVRWRKVGGRVVVLHQTSGAYYTLNDMGGFLWESMDGRRKLGAILQMVMERYAVEEPVARADLMEIAQDLIDEGLVRTGRDPMIEAEGPRGIDE